MTILEGSLALLLLTMARVYGATAAPSWSTTERSREQKGQELTLLELGCREKSFNPLELSLEYI